MQAGLRRWRLVSALAYILGIYGWGEAGGAEPGGWLLCNESARRQSVGDSSLAGRAGGIWGISRF